MLMMSVMLVPMMLLQSADNVNNYYNINNKDNDNTLDNFAKQYIIALNNKPCIFVFAKTYFGLVRV